MALLHYFYLSNLLKTRPVRGALMHQNVSYIPMATVLKVARIGFAASMPPKQPFKHNLDWNWESHKQLNPPVLPWVPPGERGYK